MIGEKLGKYVITENIGSGNMGTVYRGEDPTDGRLVAVKVVRASVLYDAEKRERFLQGLLTASGIHHPRICPILEIGDEDDDFFIVSPFLRGEVLERVLHNKSLLLTQALEIALAAGEALCAVHAAGAVHRAFKPANIWLLGGTEVMLTDCCVARFTEIESADSVRAHGPRIDFAETIIPMGALSYMSPEQIRGDPLDHRSDIFSFGVVLYEMLAGHHPFEARNSLSRMSAILEAYPVGPSFRKPNTPVELDGILARALAKAPQDRYQSMDELLAALRLVRSGDKAATAECAAYAHSHWPRRHWYAAFIAGALLIASLAFCIYRLVLR